MDRPLLRSAAGSIVIGNPVTGGGANRVLFEDASQNLATNSGFTFASNVLTAPTITATTAFVGPQISAGSTGGVMSFTDTAGEGPLIAAGVAASNARRALKISQTWTDGTTGNIGIVGNFDMGSTGTATGDLINLQAGAAGTTKVFGVDYLGVTTSPAIINSGGVSIGPTTSTYVANFTTSARLNLYNAAFTQILGSYNGANGAAQIKLHSGGVFGFTADSTDGSATTAVDTGISRSSAGVVAIGTGAAGSFAGRIKLTSTITAAVAVSALNASPTIGEIQTVNDASAVTAKGATVAAGGSAVAVVVWDGSNWVGI